MNQKQRVERLQQLQQAVEARNFHHDQLIWTSSGIDYDTGGLRWKIWCEDCRMFVEPANPQGHDLASFYVAQGQEPGPDGR